MFYRLFRIFFWFYFNQHICFFNCQYNKFIEAYNYTNRFTAKFYKVHINNFIFFNHNLYSKLFYHKKMLNIFLYFNLFFSKTVDQNFIQTEYKDIMNKKFLYRYVQMIAQKFLPQNNWHYTNVMYEIEYIQKIKPLLFQQIISIPHLYKTYVSMNQNNINFEKNIYLKDLLDTNLINYFSLSPVYFNFQLFIKKNFFYLYITIIEKNIYFIIYKKNNNKFVIMKQWCLGFFYKQKTLDIFDEGFIKILSFIKMFCNINLISIAWIYINLFFWIKLDEWENILLTKLLTFFSEKNFDFIYFYKKKAHNGCRQKKERRVKKKFIYIL